MSLFYYEITFVGSWFKSTYNLKQKNQAVVKKSRCIEDPPPIKWNNAEIIIMLKT